VSLYDTAEVPFPATHTSAVDDFMARGDWREVLLETSKGPSPTVARSETAPVSNGGDIADTGAVPAMIHLVFKHGKSGHLLKANPVSTD
jgi:hypothetical protein